MHYIVDWFVGKWQARCPHASHYVMFDLLERTIDDVENVRYCNRCGAVRIGRQTEWRRPRPAQCGRTKELK
jgi:hypothetical protein